MGDGAAPSREAAELAFPMLRVALLDSLGLGDDGRVLLEFDDESHVVPVSTLRAWADRFGVDVGWHISRLDGDARAGVGRWSYGTGGSAGITPIVA